jgi:hypothetical protein
MKLDKLIKPDKEIHIKKKQKQEFKMVGSILMKPGLKLWEFDFEKMEIKEADIKNSVSISYIDELPNEEKKVYHNAKAYYFQALNLKNAVKKANKLVLEYTKIENYFKFEKGRVLRKVI